MGQRHRLINLQRVAALRGLLTGHPDVRARRLVTEARRWSVMVGDPSRLARSELVLAEFQSNASARAAEAWECLSAAEVWRPYVAVPKLLYRAGQLLGSARLRRIALALLETS